MPEYMGKMPKLREEVSSMLRIAICDDEKYFISEMKEILEKYLNEKGLSYEIDTYSSGEDLVDLGVGIIKYNVIFLDISMENLDGMMAAKAVREISRDVFIVFVTAYANYLLDGYKVDAVRYILKKSESLVESVYECMDAIQDKMNYKVIWKEYNFNEGHKKVSLEHLLYIESELHKLKFYIQEEELAEYTLYQTLDAIDEELAENDFVRIHQSFLVNMKCIRNVKRYTVTLNNGIQLNIPKARYKYVDELFVAYKGEL